MATSRKKTKDRRKEIVVATLGLLADESLETLTTRRIAKALGVSQPALFRHFPTRASLLSAVLEHVRTELGGLAERAIADAQGPTEALLGLAAALLGHVQAHPGLPRLLFAGASSGSPLQGDLRKVVGMPLAIVSELVRQGQAQGQLSRQWDAEAAASAFLGLVQGFILQWELEDRPDGLMDQAARLHHLWLDGVRPREAVAARPAPAPEILAAGGLAVLDVRPILAAGSDPFREILAAVDGLAPPGLVEIAAPFRPGPMIALLEGRGHGVEASEHAGAWRVTVTVGAAEGPVDLTTLEAPEPFARALELAERLPADRILLLRTPQVPRPLLAELERRGFSAEAREGFADDGLVRIWRQP